MPSNIQIPIGTPTGPTWSDQLFQVGLQVLQAGAMTAVGKINNINSRMRLF